jgi:YgiT-type zinc finger domain-containing protein
MGGGIRNQEAAAMKCQECGSNLKPLTTDLPFKISEATIVILKDLPVLQCENCSEYLIDDPVMGRVEEILERVSSAAELEIIRYAA